MRLAVEHRAPQGEAVRITEGACTMGIFLRLSDLVSANLHFLLDKAEDPPKMIAQLIREMEDGLNEARRYAATAIAAERRLSRELDYRRAQAEHWKQKASQALALQREELARRALARKIEHDELARGLEGQYTYAVQSSVQVRTCL